jgi:hypothetical protein
MKWRISTEPSQRVLKMQARSHFARLTAMRRKTTFRIVLGALAVGYFPLKFYWLDTHHPRFWLRLAVSAIFWVALFGVGILSERAAD